MFAANAVGTGRELWLSDGTTAGTVLLKDIHSGTAHSRPRDFVEYQGRVYFSASDGQTGRELWQTDGTPAGTGLVADIRTGKTSSSPRRAASG